MTRQGGPFEPRQGHAVGALLIAAATLTGLWVRVSLASSSGLWRDEVQSLAISRLPTIREMILFLVHEESHPPLFYLIERAWTTLMGTSDAAVVMLGLIPGGMLIPAAALVAWRWSGPWGGGLAAWLVAVAWPAVWQAGEARPYALLSLFAVVAAAAALEALRRPRLRYWAALSVCSMALGYTHNWALLVVASLALLTLCGLLQAPRSRRRQFRRWIACFGAVALAWLPWGPVVVRQARNTGYPPPSDFPVEWLVVLPIFLLALTVQLALPAGLALLVGTWRRRPAAERPDAARFFAAAAVLPGLFALAAWPVTDLTIAHCVQILTPVMLLAVATLFTRPGPEAGRGMAGAIALAAILGAATLTWRLKKSNLREVAVRVSLEAAPDDLVIIFPATLAPSFRRYAAGGMDIVTFPPSAEGGPSRFSEYVESYEDSLALADIFARIGVQRRSAGTVWLLSQVRNGEIGDSTAGAGTRERWKLNYDRRMRQVRNSLRTAYGPHDAGFPAVDSIRARERVRAERYAPPQEE
jgi:mannosyltransferase